MRNVKLRIFRRAKITTYGNRHQHDHSNYYDLVVHLVFECPPSDRFIEAEVEECRLSEIAFVVAPVVHTSPTPYGLTLTAAQIIVL